MHSRANSRPVFKVDLHDLENSQIDWSKYQPSIQPVLKAKYPLKPHKKSAVTDVLLGLKSADRGKLIMACGTGKTFTSLKNSEEIAGKNKLVHFLVPSLNLLTEWTQQRPLLIHCFG
jgi:predicted helicase